MRKERQILLVICREPAKVDIKRLYRDIIEIPRIAASMGEGERNETNSSYSNIIFANDGRQKLQLLLLNSAKPSDSTLYHGALSPHSLL